MNPHHAHDHHHSTSGHLLWLATGLTLAYAGVEAGVGWWAGSLALVADAGHMINDAAALTLAAVAAWLARRPASARHSYGFGRAEFLAALVNSLGLLILVAWLTISAIQRLHNPQPVSGEAVSLTASVGLVINILVAWLLSRGERTLNTRAALLHVLGDLLGSVAALLAGIVIAFTGWTPIDPLLSLGIGALVLVSSLRLLRESLHGLMEGTPFNIAPEQVGRALATLPGVASVHDLHIWSVAPERVMLSAHLVVRDLRQWELLLDASHALLAERFGIHHATLQPEPETRTVRWLTAPDKSAIHPSLFLFAMLLLFPLLSSAVELTQQEKDYLATVGSIKVCVDPDWYPFERLNDQGEHEGIAADLLRLVAERAGIRLEIAKTASWDESIQASKDNKCQILSFLNQTPKREEWLFFTQPYFTDVNVFVARNEHPYIADPATLTDETIVFPEGTAMEEFIRNNYPNLRVINTKTENEAFILVSENKADIAMRSLIMAAYTIRKEGLFNMKIAGQLPNYTNKLRIGVIKSEPILVNILNKGINAITNQDREQIVNRHISIEIKGYVDYKLIFQIAAFLGLLTVISLYWNYKLNKLNDRLIKIAQTDVLTGLYNRTKLNEQFHFEHTRAVRYGRPFSVIMLDIDHFKKINDGFGHLIGDKVLIDFASLAQKCVRNCDIIGRWGGEEFLVLCPETELKDAVLIAERIRQSVKEYPFATGHPHTISAGVAAFILDDTEDSLLQRADTALYKAKNSSRDRVCFIDAA